MSVQRVFAYGSNMDPDDLAQWFRRRDLGRPAIERAVAAELSGHELAFNYRSPSRGAGAANVQPHPERVVHGLVLWTDDATLERLDEKEGAPHRYARRQLRVRLRDGDLVETWVYRVTAAYAEAGYVAPTAYYLGLIQRAARRHGFPEDYRAWLAGLPVSK